MTLVWAENAWADYLNWQETDRKMAKRINKLIKDTIKTPFENIGKPEPLRFEFAGKWSRRTDEEHRLVYEVKNNELIIYQCRKHYYQ
jgi:toxin YoeB